MKTHRVWVEIVILGSSVACALALLIATLGTVAGAANGAGEPRQATSASSAEQTYQGMVTCSRCGAKHSAALGKTAADCVRVCVSGGAKFSLVDGEQTYFLDGDNSLFKGLAGRRTRVVGTISGKTIKVSSIATT